MTQFYPASSSSRCIKSFLLLTSFLCIFYASRAQVYYVSLSGTAEVPPNNSAGTGKALITISGNFMTVHATFSGLTGNTTASHIHAPTATASAGTAGVATTTPTFTNFPLGVKAGSYDHSFDMTLATSYNPAYVTANGGTPASAFTALKTAMAAGKSYLNVHSSFAPGGEIRGFLLPCPSMTVSIPDAFALTQGVLPNTVYPAYIPASSLTLQANVSGGTGPFTYTWSNGAISAETTVSPTIGTTYSVTVQDPNGCPGGTASKTVNVMDIAGGRRGENIIICHKGKNTLTIGAPAVASHLEHGDMLGDCNEQGQPLTTREIGLGQGAKNVLSVRVLANPSTSYFELQMSGKTDKVQIRVYDIQGRLLETKPSLQSNQTLRLGASYRPGVYLVQIVQGAELQTLRLVKTN